MTAKSLTTDDVKDAPVKAVAREGVSGVRLHMGMKQADGSYEAGSLKNIQKLITENP